MLFDTYNWKRPSNLTIPLLSFRLEVPMVHCLLDPL